MANAYGRHEFGEEQITTGLMALVAWAGNASAASRSLKAEGKLIVSAPTLTHWAKHLHALRYNDLREKYREQLEGQLVHEMRDTIAHALDVERLGLEKAKQRLAAGKDDDPARTASHAARVAQSNADKMLSISGRPTSIREDRNVEEILRGLIARGLLELPAPLETGAGEGDRDGAGR